MAFELARYREAGCRSYWVLDPLRPSIRVFELEQSRYREAASAVGEATVNVLLPFPLRITPTALRRD